MYARAAVFSLLALLTSAPLAHAATLYEQTDASGEMVSQQLTNQMGNIQSQSLGTLELGKDPLTLTFSMQDPNAGTYPASAPEGVALRTCGIHGQQLQTYFFTAADRTALAAAGSSAFHTFTVTTGSTPLGLADGSNAICIEFFGLSQWQYSTHIKSNGAGTLPALTIMGELVPEEEPEFPEGTTVIYEQSDDTGTMSNPQETNLTGYINSESLGEVPVGQGTVYLKFRMKDPNASTGSDTPTGLCLQPAESADCNDALQTYLFTDADRTLLSDHAFHWFMVTAATTTSTYAASSTEPISIGFYGLSQVQNGTHVKANAAETIPFLSIAAYVEAEEATSTPPVVEEPEEEEQDNSGGGGRTFTRTEQEAAEPAPRAEEEPAAEAEPTPTPVAVAQAPQPSFLPPTPPQPPTSTVEAEEEAPAAPGEVEPVAQPLQTAAVASATTDFSWDWLLNWWWLWLLLLALLYLLYRYLHRPDHRKSEDTQS